MISVAQTSISVQEDTRDRLDDLRGDKYRSWDVFLNELADAYEAGAGSGGGLGSVDVDELASAVAGRIDYAELSNRTAEEIEGRMTR